MSAQTEGATRQEGAARGEASVRREGAGEVRLLAALVVVLLVGAYLSWTRKDDTTAVDKVNINELAPAQVNELVWMTRTQTVTVAKKKSSGGDEYPWFAVKTGKTTRNFKGNKSTTTLFESFAPFVAVRSLGVALDEAQLKDAKLDRPDNKLLVRTSGDDKKYEVGGRTFGSRDWYVRPAGGKEVFVVASRVLQDLEFSEGKFMQRDLLVTDKKDLTGVVITAGAVKNEFAQQNRLSPSDAFWTRSSAPDVKDEAVGNYLRKLENLKAVSYADEGVLTGATKVLELAWMDGEKVKESMTLYRGGDKDKVTYYAVADATVMPVEVAKSVAEQLEKDLQGILQDEKPAHP